MKYILTVCIVLNIYFLYKNIRKAKELKKEKEQIEIQKIKNRQLLNTII